MTPHKQLILHDTSNGQFGDCDRTAIACLLDMAPDDVPHWYDGFNGLGQANATALEIRRNWLADRGLFLVSVPYEADAMEQILELIAINHPGIHYLIAGMSPRGVNHVVICRDRSVVHDPHPTDNGLIGPCDDGYWWVNFLGKIT